MKLTIDKLIYGGQGLARIPQGEPQAGMRVFVPFTLPEEIVEAEITGRHRGYCSASVQRVERVSTFRATPPCEWFGTCGGCQLQHSAYPYQVELKREMLAESMTRAGLQRLPAISALTREPLGYRNRVRLQIETAPRFAIGYRQAKSHRITAIDHCPVAAPLIQQCLATVRTIGLEQAVPEDVLELELFTNHNQSQLLLALWTEGRVPFRARKYADFFARLQNAIPQLTGAVVHAGGKAAAPTARPLLQWQHQGLSYRAAGRDYSVSLGSFFQINRGLVDDFVNAVTAIESGGLAWDLYAGAGLFSLPLAEKFSQLVAVESAPSAVKDLRCNLQGANATAVSSTTLEFLQRAVKQQPPAPDLVVLDPPRAGAGAEVCSLLSQCAPRRIVYVSCDPATLGRDLAALIQSGYRLDRLQLVDMFPQTSHLETIATLQR